MGLSALPTDHLSLFLTWVLSYTVTNVYRFPVRIHSAEVDLAGVSEPQTWGANESCFLFKTFIKGLSREDKNSLLLK